MRQDNVNGRMVADCFYKSLGTDKKVRRQSITAPWHCNLLVHGGKVGSLKAQPEGSALALHFWMKGIKHYAFRGGFRNASDCIRGCSPGCADTCKLSTGLPEVFLLSIRLLCDPYLQMRWSSRGVETGWWYTQKRWKIQRKMGPMDTMQIHRSHVYNQFCNFSSWDRQRDAKASGM